MSARVTFAVCIMLCVVPLASYGQIWDLAGDFSATQNPTGAWSYGWRAAPGDPLVLFTDHEYPCPTLASWVYRHEPYSEPCLVQNPLEYPVSCFSWVLEPHKVLFHPGPEQQGVARWTAPADLEADLTVHFVSIDFGDKIVHVYYNQTELFSATLANDDAADFSKRISFRAGDTIDCAIDPISFYYDSTQLDVTLEATQPTPVDEESWGGVKAVFR
jgi:hypothetical protein